jgi:signal transduction histidine kinase
MSGAPTQSDGTSGSADADRLQELHAATRELMDAETRTDVAVVATEAARDVLDLSMNAVFFREDDRLVPAVATDAVYDIWEEVPTLYRGKSTGWQVYESGEAAAFDDVREADLLQNPETPMRSELLLPLGDHGLFVAGSTTSSAFDAGRISLAKVFAANVETALDRAEREERLARQNERLDRFASVVSHDLRNPLNVAQGHLQLARETGGDEQFDAIERAHDRIEGLLDDLLALARAGSGVGSTEAVSFVEAVESARADLPVPLDVTVADGGTVEADQGRLRELLTNLLSNAATHGATSVRLGMFDDGDGFYVADDGPGIPPEDREQVFDHGYTTTAEGSGFGLAIVADIATAHGWSVHLGESEAGGLLVEVYTGAASDEVTR